MILLPSAFRPRCANDFVGPARQWAVHLEKQMRLAMPTQAPLRVILLGPPGVGKSQLAEHLVRLTGAGRFSISKYNGTGFRIQDAEEMRRSFYLRDIFGGYRVLQIEEVDKVPTVAQVALLTLLDELPPATAVICTSNCGIRDLEERFQRRFTVCEVKGPTQDELFRWLREKWPELPKQRAVEISTFACGNVGAALMDTETALVERMAA